MKTVVGIAGLILLWLQYALWFGTSGHFDQARLKQQLEQQKERVSEIALGNEKLAVEVFALEGDRRNFESQARESLGMIREGEHLYLVPDDR